MTISHSKLLTCNEEIAILTVSNEGTILQSLQLTKNSKAEKEGTQSHLPSFYGTSGNNHIAASINHCTFHIVT